MEAIDPINFDASEDDERTFPCSCGDPTCRGFNDDAGNIRLGKAWYAADCELGNRLWQIAQGREWDAVNDERRNK